MMLGAKRAELAPTASNADGLKPMRTKYVLSSSVKLELVRTAGACSRRSYCGWTKAHPYKGGTPIVSIADGLKPIRTRCVLSSSALQIDRHLSAEVILLILKSRQRKYSLRILFDNHWLNLTRAEVAQLAGEGFQLFIFKTDSHLDLFKELCIQYLPMVSFH